LWNESNASQKHEISDSKSQFKEKAPIQFRNSLSGERGESKSSRNLLDQILDEPLTVLSRGRDRSVDDYEDYTARGMPFEPLTPPQHQINIGAEPAYIANEDTGLYTAISESAVAPRMSYEEEKVHQEKSRQIPGLSEPDQQGLLDSPTPNATMQQHGLPRVGLNFDLDQMPPGIPDTPSIPQRLTEVAYEQHHPPLYMRYTISQDMTAEAEPLQISKLSAIKDRHMCLKDRAALLEIFSNRSSKSRTTEETLPTRETPLTLSGGDYRKANLARQIRTPT
jgi:hypothetical protein